MSDTDSDAARGAGRAPGDAWVPPQGAPGQPPPPGYWSPPQDEPGQVPPPASHWQPPQGQPAPEPWAPDRNA